MVGGNSGGAGNSSSLLRVTFEYSSGLTMILEGTALSEWEQNYLAGINARAVVQHLQQQQAEAQAAPQPSNIRNLRDAIQNKVDGEQ